MINVTNSIMTKLLLQTFRGNHRKPHDGPATLVTSCGDKYVTTILPQCWREIFFIIENFPARVLDTTITKYTATKAGPDNITQSLQNTKTCGGGYFTCKV